MSFLIVHCRTGSLESITTRARIALLVHCRTGSLEIEYITVLFICVVHCRTGSLENAKPMIDEIIKDNS